MDNCGRSFNVGVGIANGNHLMFLFGRLDFHFQNLPMKIMLNGMKNKK